MIKSATSQAAAPAPAFSKVEPIRSTPLEVVPLATPPRVEKHVEAEPRTSFGTFDSVSTDEPKSGSKFMVIGVVAVVIIAAAATFTFLKMQKSKAPQAQEAANTVDFDEAFGNRQSEAAAGDLGRIVRTECPSRMSRTMSRGSKALCD